VFLDLKMPGRNGFDVLEWIRGQPTPFPFPVLVLSGSHEPADMQRAKELGAKAYLVKPITSDKLREILDQKTVRI
jgi:CheY-like chemotaxis protein